MGPLRIEKKKSQSIKLTYIAKYILKSTYPSLVSEEAWLGLEWVRGEVEGLKEDGGCADGVLCSGDDFNASARHTKSHTGIGYGS